MVRKFLVVIAVASFIAPAMVFAHAGHEHGAPAPPVQAQKVEPPHQPPSGPDMMQMRLMQENTMLRRELEKEKAMEKMKEAAQATEKAATRSAYIITGLLFCAAGLAVRYYPGKEA
jgi:hypothetical protein